MKIRSDSWVIAVMCLIAGISLWRGASQFRSMFADLGYPLPLLTRAILSVPPITWFALLTALGVLALARDVVPQQKKTKPNWPFLVALVLVCVIVVMALFQPMMGTRLLVGA